MFSKDRATRHEVGTPQSFQRGPHKASPQVIMQTCMTSARPFLDQAFARSQRRSFCASDRGRNVASRELAGHCGRSIRPHNATPPYQHPVVKFLERTNVSLQTLPGNHLPREPDTRARERTDAGRSDAPNASQVGVDKFRTLDMHLARKVVRKRLQV